MLYGHVDGFTESTKICQCGLKVIKTQGCQAQQYGTKNDTRASQVLSNPMPCPFVHVEPDPSIMPVNSLNI